MFEIEKQIDHENYDIISLFMTAQSDALTENPTSDRTVQVNLPEIDASASERLTASTDVITLHPDQFTQVFPKLLNTPDAPIADPDSETVGGLITTNPDAPRVIFETDATPCTLFVTFNDSGESAIAHQPLASNVQARGELSPISLSTINNLNQVASRDGLTQKLLITGTNIPEPERSAVLQQVRPLFTSLAPEQIVEKFSPDPNKESYYGTAFIPKQLSADGRNKVLVLAKRPDEQPSSPTDFLKPQRATTGFSVSID